MSQSELVVVAPNEQTQKDEIIDLVCKTFGHSYFDFERWCRGGYIEDAPVDWAASRIGMIDGRIVTNFMVWDYAMRIGGAKVWTGGVGVVATHGSHRKKGYMDVTAAASVAAMKELGYDFSILFGIDNFYHRFGYTRAWAESEYIVRTADLPREAPERPIEGFTFEPRADLHALYNAAYGTATGTAVRPFYRRPDPRAARLGYCWKDGRGKVAGYIGVADRGSHVQVLEFVGDAEQVLRAIAMVANQMGADDVRFGAMATGCAVARRLRRGNLRVERHYRKCGGPMVRLVNLEQALKKMAGELARRLKGSPLCDWQGEVVVANREAAVVLGVEKGKIRVGPAKVNAKGKHVIRGGDEVAQLLVGTDSPAEIAEVYGMELKGDARWLVEALFPEQDPILGAVDRY